MTCAEAVKELTIKTAPKENFEILPTKNHNFNEEFLEPPIFVSFNTRILN